MVHWSLVPRVNEEHFWPTALRVVSKDPPGSPLELPHRALNVCRILCAAVAGCTLHGSGVKGQSSAGIKHLINFHYIKFQKNLYSSKKKKTY